MRAFVVRQPTDDLSGAAMETVSTPAPAAGEVLVRVRAAGVNFPDLLMAQGKYQLKPEPPFSPGLEIAGSVEALGDGVEGVRVGQRVAAGVRFGGFAEMCRAPAEALWPLPDTIDDASAACFMATAITAQVALVRRAQLQAGETVLVHGAAGGVGLACVARAYSLGARVIATASTPQKRQALHEHGVEIVLPSNGFRDPVLEHTDGRGADVIVDPVGGDVFAESLRCIAFDGRLLVVGFAGGAIPTLSVNHALIKGISVMGVRAGEYGRRFPDRGRDDRAALWAMLAEGQLKPVIGAQFALQDAKSALMRLAARDVIGKVVLLP